MKKETVIKMYIEAIKEHPMRFRLREPEGQDLAVLERFAELVLAHERREICKMATTARLAGYPQEVVNDLIDAILARGTE